MTEAKFAMEYGSIFVGAESGSVFPYELTEKCRRLTDVEIAQPAKSTAQYVMGVDLATSSAKHADNAVICMVKLVELESGAFLKKLVYIRSYHGKRLDSLASEVRKMLVKFPNTIKIVFDHRGLGDAFPQFLSRPWTDPETNKEYPPLVLDEEKSLIHNALPLLRAVIANNMVNQQMVSATTVALEQEAVEIPVNSRYIVNGTVAKEDESSDEPKKKLTMQEKAIFIEADALQIEMGNIIGKEMQSGAVIYDVAKSTQHKDRYSALAMAIRYIGELEDDRKKRLVQKQRGVCIGIVTKF